MLGTSDIARSQRFYDAVLGVFGAGAPTRNENATGQVRLFYRHDGSTFCLTQIIDGRPATVSNGFTLGFSAARPSSSSSSTMWPIHGGTSIEEPPGPRHGGAVYLAYVRDPDGTSSAACTARSDARRGRASGARRSGAQAVDALNLVSRWSAAGPRRAGSTAGLPHRLARRQQAAVALQALAQPAWRPGARRPWPDVGPAPAARPAGLATGSRRTRCPACRWGSSRTGRSTSARPAACRARAGPPPRRSPAAKRSFQAASRSRTASVPATWRSRSKRSITCRL